MAQYLQSQPRQAAAQSGWSEQYWRRCHQTQVELVTSTSRSLGLEPLDVHPGMAAACCWGLPHIDLLNLIIDACRPVGLGAIHGATHSGRCRWWPSGCGPAAAPCRCKRCAACERPRGPDAVRTAAAAGGADLPRGQAPRGEILDCLKCRPDPAASSCTVPSYCCATAALWHHIRRQLPGITGRCGTQQRV